MAEYKGIKGFKVQTVSTDPAASVIATGTWASGGDLNTAVNASGASNAGTQTASINFAGNAAPYPTVTNAAESYNGTSWSPISNMGTARWVLSSFGPQTAAVGVGGVTDVNAVLPTTAVEQWNGTSWTEVAELATERYSSGGFGTGTAALIAGGASRPGAPPGTPVTYRANVESWNGTSWTAGTAINTARSSMFSFGISTTGLIANGSNPTSPIVSNAESWNGTSWTEVAESNTTRYSGGAAGSSNTLGLIFGGFGPSFSSQTEYWDGTSWTELNNLANAKVNLSGSGSVPSALAYAGSSSPGTASAATEEWTVAPPASFQKENLGQVFYNSISNAFKVTKQSIPAGTWASGGTYPSAVYGSGGFGTQTAAVGIGGQLPPATPGSTNATNNYDGTSWTSSGNYPTSQYYLFGAGTQTAGLAAGGGLPFSTASFEYDGSTWSNPATMNIGRSYAIYNVGTQTAAYYFGGFIPSNPNATTTENYNGTSWSPGTNINTAREASAGFGIQTSAIMAGGTNPPGRVNNVESWNGTSWTEVAEINTARSYVGGGGNSNSSGIIFGGATATAPTALTEYWNGTTWTELNDLSTATDNIGNLGSDTAALRFGGTTPTPTNSTQTEEWTAVTLNSTLTAS